MNLLKNPEYAKLLSDLKERIRSAQIKAAFSINKELILLYWDIGKTICERQKQSKWGDSIIELIASDISKEFPGMRGFSRTNLFNMRQWYMFYSENKKIQQLVGLLPWGHNIVIINRAKNLNEAEFYIVESIKNHWSRNILIHQIESRLYERKGKIISNFEITLPKKQSELTKAVLKDPYVFDFLLLTEDAQEKDIEEELTKHITKFLLELGAGFAFLGSQYHLEISNHDYYIDLLFYHLKLRSYIVIELKAGEFKPEYTGKLSFYLSIVNDVLRKKEDKPTIGIILCKTKDKIIAEYALKDMAKPIGISEYKIVHSIPERLKANLPSIRELESELSRFTKKKTRRKTINVV